MTPSQYVKRAGLSSLAEVSRVSGVSVQTLNNWFEHKPDLFKYLILGVLYQKDTVGLNPMFIGKELRFALDGVR